MDLFCFLKFFFWHIEHHKPSEVPYIQNEWDISTADTITSYTEEEKCYLTLESLIYYLAPNS